VINLPTQIVGENIFSSADLNVLEKALVGHYVDICTGGAISKVRKTHAFILHVKALHQNALVATASLILNILL
jgi:hydrogenase maturation factor